MYVHKCMSVHLLLHVVRRKQLLHPPPLPSLHLPAAGYWESRCQTLSSPSFVEMREAFDGWCSFSKLCLGHFRCIRPTSFGLYVFNLTSRRVKVWLRRWMRTPLPLLAGWKWKTWWEGWREVCVCVWGDGVDSKIESVWKQPYKEKQRSECCRERPDC